ncbi:MAG: hypothetical protein VCF07_04780, partial [Nitrospinota bacterium]
SPPSAAREALFSAEKGKPYFFVVNSVILFSKALRQALRLNGFGGAFNVLGSPPFPSSKYFP